MFAIAPRIKKAVRHARFEKKGKKKDQRSKYSMQPPECLQCNFFFDSARWFGLPMNAALIVTRCKKNEKNNNKQASRKLLAS